MTARILPRVAAAACTALLVCRPPEAAIEAPPSPRWFDVAPNSVVWSAGRAGDSLPSDIGAIAADDSLVYILDRWHGDVLALDARSGRRRWRWRPSTGNDARPDAAAPASGLSTSAPGVLVARPDGRALIELDRRGRAMRTIVLDRREFLFGICALPDRRALVATARSAAAWLLVGGGAPPRAVPPPWPDSMARPAVGWQGAPAPLPGDAGCAIALSVGAGFAVIAPHGAARAAPYVEPVAPARFVDRPVHQGARNGVARKLDGATIAATGAAVHGDTLFVAFGGTSADRGRLVDRYLWRSGRYAGSWRLASAGARIAITRERLYVLGDADGQPTIAAYRRRMLARVPRP